LIDGVLAAADDQVVPLALRLLRDVDAANAEIITIYYGDDITLDEAKSLRVTLEGEFNHQEIQVHWGGQPLYPYIISVE
jgi:dihydroxyacetone kinase-like predicted kinase